MSIAVVPSVVIRKSFGCYETMNNWNSVSIYFGQTNGKIMGLKVQA
jgi:hypothetical protein